MLMLKKKKLETVKTEMHADNQNNITQSDIYKKGSELVFKNIEEENPKQELTQEEIIANITKNISDNIIADHHMIKLLEYFLGLKYYYDTQFIESKLSDVIIYSKNIANFILLLAPNPENTRYVLCLEIKREKELLGKYFSNIDGYTFEKIIREQRKKEADEHLQKILNSLVIDKDITH